MSCGFCSRRGHNFRNCNSPLVGRLSERINNKIVELYNRFRNNPSFPGILHSTLDSFTLPEIKVVFANFVGTLCNFNFNCLRINFQLNKNVLLFRIVEEIIYQLRTPTRINELRIYEERYGNISPSPYIPQLSRAPTLNFTANIEASESTARVEIREQTQNRTPGQVHPQVHPIIHVPVYRQVQNRIRAEDRTRTHTQPPPLLQYDEIPARYIPYANRYLEIFNIPIPNEIKNDLIYFESIYRFKYPLTLFTRDMLHIVQNSIIQNNRIALSQALVDQNIYGNYIMMREDNRLSSSDDIVPLPIQSHRNRNNDIRLLNQENVNIRSVRANQILILLAVHRYEQEREDDSEEEIRRYAERDRTLYPARRIEELDYDDDDSEEDAHRYAERDRTLYPARRIEELDDDILSPIRPNTSRRVSKTIEAFTCTEEDECPICYNNLFSLKKIKTNCNHIFCNDCFDNHISHNNNMVVACPMCRTAVQNIKVNE